MTALSATEGMVAAGAVGAAVGFLLVAALVPQAIALSRRLEILDEPGARSSHTVDTPRLGGLAVAAGALVGLGVALAVGAWVGPPASYPTDGRALAGAAVIATAFGLIGFWDDLERGVPVRLRLLAQAAVGIGLVAPWLLLGHHGAAIAVVGAAAGALWAAGFVNAFNFLDGVDGMSAMVGVVIGLDLALVGVQTDAGALVLLGLVLAGATAGFLPHNLRTGKVFLGDGGSYLLGGWIAAAVLVALAAQVRPEAVLAVTIPCLADTSSTLVRRIARGADWRESHREHAYQRLVDLGWSHRSVSTLVATTSACCAALGLVALHASSGGRLAAAAAVLGLSAGYVALPSMGRSRVVAR